MSVYRLQNRGHRAPRDVLGGQFVSSTSCLPSASHPFYDSLMTNIAYMPETIAERPSPLKEQAYVEELPLAIPALDPGGWKLLPQVEAIGTMVPNATVIAQLSISNPVRFCFSHLIGINTSFGTGIVCTGNTNTAIPRDT